MQRYNQSLFCGRISDRNGRLERGQFSHIKHHHQTGVTSDLLLVPQKVGQLLGCQVVLPVAVRHHQQEEVASQGHHLVEDRELLVG